MTSLNVHWVERLEVDKPWQHPELIDATTGMPLPSVWSNHITAHLKDGTSVEVCFFSENAPLGLKVEK